MLTLHQLLEEMIEKGASDLHLTAGVPPQLRIDGAIQPTTNDPLTAFYDLVDSIVRDVMAVVSPRVREDVRLVFES